MGDENEATKTKKESCGERKQPKNGLWGCVTQRSRPPSREYVARWSCCTRYADRSRNSGERLVTLPGGKQIKINKNGIRRRKANVKRCRCGPAFEEVFKLPQRNANDGANFPYFTGSVGRQRLGCLPASHIARADIWLGTITPASRCLCPKLSLTNYRCARASHVRNIRGTLARSVQITTGARRIYRRAFT